MVGPQHSGALEASLAIEDKRSPHTLGGTPVSKVDVVSVITWDAAFHEFRVYTRRDARRRASTLKSHVAHLRALAELVPAGPGAVTSSDVLVWLEQCGASRRNAWNAARSFFGWAARFGVVAESPAPAPPVRRLARRTVGNNLPPVWGEALATYIERMQSTGSPVRSMEVRLRYVRALARDHSDPWAVTYDDLVRWLAAHEGWAPETRKSARLALAGFYRHAVERGMVAESPAAHLAKVRVPRAVPRPAPTDALHGALMDADDRGRLMLLLAAYAGLRAGEIAQVRPSTDVQDGLLYVTGKNGDQRVVPLHPVLTEALRAELERRRLGEFGSGFTRLVETPDPKGYLFPGAGGGHLTAGRVSVLLSRALPDRWTAHTLRHRFASQAYASVLDIRAVQELLGHSSPLTTARYTAVPAGHLVRAVLGVQ